MRRHVLCAMVNLHFLVLRLLVEEMFVVCLLCRIWCKQTGAIGILAPDGGPVGAEQLLELGIQARGICGKVEQGVSLLGQLFAQLGDLAGQLAIVWVVELGDAAVGGGAGGGQAQAQTFRNLAYGGIMRTEDADPAGSVPAPHAMLEVQCQIVL
jgi:hypothetical protein